VVNELLIIFYRFWHSACWWYNDSSDVIEISPDSIRQAKFMTKKTRKHRLAPCTTCLPTIIKFDVYSPKAPSIVGRSIMNVG